MKKRREKIFYVEQLVGDHWIPVDDCKSLGSAERCIQFRREKECPHDFNFYRVVICKVVPQEIVDFN